MITNKNCNYLEEYFKKNIPLTKAININVLAYDGYSIILSAPLQGNENDKGIGFAGSIFSTAILTAWGLVTLKLRDLKIEARVVASKASINYQKPVTTNFQTRCSVTDSEWDKFFKNLEKRKNSTLKVTVAVMEKGGETECAQLMAEIFAWYKKTI